MQFTTKLVIIFIVAIAVSAAIDVALIGAGFKGEATDDGVALAAFIALTWGMADVLDAIKGKSK